LLETLRQYRQERLIDRGDADVLADRHAQFYVTLAERAEPEFYSHAALTALSRLEQEHDNCRKALRWLVDRLDAEDTQRLAGAMGRFWFFRGYVAESSAWLKQALALPGGDRPTAGRAKCLYGLGSLALSQGDFEAMERAMQEALALWRALGNACEEGFTLFSLGLASRLRADYPSARVLLEAGVEVSRAADCGAAETNNLFALAELAYEEGNDVEARERAEAALARASGLEWTRAAAAARTVLGRVSWRQGDTTTALALLEGSLADLRELGPRFLWVVQTLTDLGELAIEQGDLSQAHARLAESLVTTAELRDRFGTARNLDGFAQLAAANGQARVSLRLAGAAATLREAIGVPRTPTNSAALEHCLKSARAALGDDTADVAWADGAALTLDQAVDYALTPIARQ
jgi:tetratricopeptide (TPR) repeat protein